MQYILDTRPANGFVFFHFLLCFAAKRLSLYQILAPNSFDYVEGFVASLNKSVKSSNYERHMVQFEWHDKSVKNVHVDPTLLYDYQKRLGSTVVLFEKRIDWLSSASRKLFGSIVENKFVILFRFLLECNLYREKCTPFFRKWLSKAWVFM